MSLNVLSQVVKTLYILVCEPAGPGFDSRVNRLVCDDRSAAKNVQIIHTSTRRFGTRCTTGGHQNIRMGHCGWDQAAGTGMQIKSHALCNYFYNAAFYYPFYGVEMPARCKATQPALLTTGFRMGYKGTQSL